MNQMGGIGLQQLLRERNAMSPEPVNFRQLLNTIFRRKWLILIGATLVAVAVGVVLREVKSVYRASATVMIESKQVNVVSIQDVYGVDTRAPDYFQTQLEVMKSRPIIMSVVDKLKLENNPAFVGPPVREGAAMHDADIVHKYMVNLHIETIPRTQLVSLSFDSPDPQLAAEIVNTHVEAFIENYLATKDAETQSATNWMSGRVEELRQRLSESEAKLQAFKERERLIDIDGFQALPARQLNELTSKLTDAKRDLSQTGNTYAQVVAVRDASLEEKLAIPAIRSDPLVQQLRQTRAEAELNVADLSKRYGALHPKLRAAVAERAAVEQSLSNQVDSVMEALKNEHQALKGQAQSIASAIDSVKTDAQLVGRKGAEYRELMREVETNRQLFDMFYKRVSETTEAGNFDSANAKVIQPALVPIAPNGLPKPVMIALAFVAAMILGALLAILFEMLDRTIKHAVDLERKIGIPLLAYVPLVKLPKKEKEASIAQEFTSHTNREFSEAIRTLRTGVTLSSIHKSQKLVILTSSIANEGKTSIACNLALSFAQAERVLLVDADLRRPSVARELDLPGNWKGLSDLCAGTATFDECVIRGFKPNLDVLPSGGIPHDPQRLLGGETLQTLLQQFKQDYDRVIIDCPPVLPVSDVLLLAAHTEILVYVIKAGSTPISQVNAGVKKFETTAVTLIGAVLNQVNTKRLAEYGEYGGGYYGDYYAANAPATV
jgi:capsular exopolysaccharide synthesis family protein